MFVHSAFAALYQVGWGKYLRFYTRQKDGERFAQR